MINEPRTRLLTTGNGSTYPFRQVALRFDGPAGSDAFARKNNKTLGQTLAHQRYVGLAKDAKDFAAFMDMPLGCFLAGLKRDGNPFYRRFLNKHGDLRYSTFAIDDVGVLRSKGVYAYYADEELRYIGRCKDTMRRRINQGYGKIHPKNCYLDGQSTNCHLNAKITDAGSGVSLWFCSLEADDEITSAEAQLIRSYRPIWNVKGL